jgi:hypothetical protein
MATPPITVIYTGTYGTANVRIGPVENDVDPSLMLATEGSDVEIEPELKTEDIATPAAFTKWLDERVRDPPELPAWCKRSVWRELLDLLELPQPPPQTPVRWPLEHNSERQSGALEGTKPDGTKPEPTADPATVGTQPPAAATTPTTEDVLTTEVVGSAESYRKQGQIFVSALAAIPAATLLTSLIRAPGDSGLEDWKLALGLTFAAAALALGVWLALHLRAPVEISREALMNFPMHRIVGTGQEGYEELLTRINQLRETLADAGDKLPAEERRFHAVLATLRSVHLLATADALRRRVTDKTTLGLAGVSLALAAAAVFFLATAPKPKAAEKAAGGPAVVKVALTPAAVTQLGCPKSTFNALKLGGSETEPQVIPLGGVKCAAGDYLTFAIKKAPAAEVTAVKPASQAPTTTTKSTTRTGPATTTP